MIIDDTPTLLYTEQTVLYCTELLALPYKEMSIYGSERTALSLVALQYQLIQIVGHFKIFAL